MKLTKEIGIIYHPDFLLHTRDGHPEHKGRLEAIIKLLEHNNLFAKLAKIEPKPAKISEIALVHNQKYIESLKTAIERGSKNLDADTYLTPYSFEAALLSAGAAITAMREVMKGKIKVGYSLGRPPGHHAEPDRGMGFCLFNNGAIAAKLAIKEFAINRILYIDFDVHHGNGTQKAFYDDPRVLFISIHQTPAYPGTGKANERGEKKGYGYNINVPLSPGCGNLEYEEVFKRIIIPVADNYCPELIIVSAGYDAYHKDPLAGMEITYEGYANMTKYIQKIAANHCNGKMIFCLEGGYHLEGQAEAFITTISVLGRHKYPVQKQVLDDKEVKNQALEVIKGIAEMCIKGVKKDYY